MNQDFIKFIKNDRFAKLVGTEIVKVEPGYAVAEMKIAEKHLNGINTVQGGAIFALADYAFAAASNSEGIVTVGINVNISYMNVPKGKTLKAEARVTSVSRRICHVEVDIVDEDNVLIAKANCTGYRKQQTV
ncbi:MAG: PaaI family thioesterase [Bacillota bacterium]|jgi:acyl-CoA thioesterase|nr:PaaI family thioesterase [Bacillota bacterium]NLV63937.1 PaaI family thioesterase [Clostridiaceae bacterium]